MSHRGLVMICAVIGLAISLPTIGLAGHHDDANDSPRPNAPHDQGWHKGWYKHNSEPDDDDRDESRHEYHHHHEHSELIYRQEPTSHRHHHHELMDQDYRRVCDEDGDDCHLVNERYWGGYDYGPPVSYYQGTPPPAYNLSQEREWLLQRRQRAYQVLAKMRERADRNAAKRMSKVVDQLDSRIARTNQLLLGGRYQPSAGLPYVSGPPSGTMYNPNDPYDDPGVNAISSFVNPLLGLPPQ